MQQILSFTPLCGKTGVGLLAGRPLRPLAYVARRSRRVGQKARPISGAGVMENVAAWATIGADKQVRMHTKLLLV